MKQITPTEILSISKLLQMETNALAISRAGINIINDEKLKTQAQSGISVSEARIRGLQQFISENNLVEQGGLQ